MKAAFVLNFLKFAEWPAAEQDDSESPLVIAAIGDTPFATSLKTILEGKLAQGRKVEVQVYRDVAAWAQTGSPSRALFVTPGAQSMWGELRERLAGQPVLTMGESPGFCAAGGMLNLYEQDDRIRFEANPVEVEKHGLKLRAELLKLATLVQADVNP